MAFANSCSVHPPYCGKFGRMFDWVRRILSRSSTRGLASRRAGVYAKPELLLVHSVRTTTAGVGLAGPDVHHLPAPFSADAVGAAARAALAAYQHDVPHPNDWTDVGKDFLVACRVRSWKALTTDARFCDIELCSDGAILLLPTHNGGTSGDGKGFRSNGSAARRVERDSGDSELGEAILATLQDCT